MKKLVPFNFLKRLLSPLFIFALTLSSCQRDIAEGSIEPTQSKQKILNWLSKQKIGLTDYGVNKIQSLIEAIDFSDLRTEIINETEKIFIVSLNDLLKTNYNKTNPSIKLLLLIENELGEIRRGHIVEYAPYSKEISKKLPTNTFHNMYSGNKLNSDGVFSFLSIFGNFQFEVVYKRGDLASSKLYKKKKDTNTFIESESCTNWYLVTTTYNPDGTTETTWEFLFTSCDECDPTMECDETGGGGSGGGTEGYEFEAVKTKDWNVFLEPISGVGEIKSVERLKGKRNSAEPQGGHFTSIVHDWSICNFCSSGNPNDVWIETSSSVSASGQSATSSVTGNLSYQGVFRPGITNTKTWSFQEVFP